MDSKIPEYTLLDHTADLGIEICGGNLKELFENAARVLVHLMIRHEGMFKGETLNIEISAADPDDLMVRWLGEILYLLEAERKIVVSAHIRSISPVMLTADLSTIPFDPQNHEIITEIKAVTYHQVAVTKKGGQWETRVIFDV